MKLRIFSTVMASIFLSSVIASTGDLIVKEEYESGAVKWEIFKKNEDELYVAKGYRGKLNPFYFAWCPKTDEILSQQSAESLWEMLDLQYNIKNYNNEHHCPTTPNLQ